MNLLLISDIHGNHFALRKVLEEARDSERVVCLGDVVWDGPQPSEVISELRKLSCPVIMGNTDEFLIGRGLRRLEGRGEETERWYRRVLSDDDRTFVSGFKPTLILNLEGDVNMFCYHGSPRSNREGVLAETPNTKIARIFSERREQILAGGHTHRQMLRRFEDRLIINPGSVGSPFEFKGKKIARNPPWAEYATIDIRGKNLSVSLKRVGYDIKDLMESTADSDMPHKDLWVKYWK